MRPKISITFLMTAIMLCLSACTSTQSSSFDTENSAPTVTDSTTMHENTPAPKESPTPQTPPSTDTPEPTITETPIPQIIEPIWYMDTEGIKNEELGIQIKKDNGVMDTSGIRVPYMLEIPINPEEKYPTSFSLIQTIFSCYYYDGTIDDFIAENDGYQKGTWNDITYCYGRELGIGINIIDNGVRFYTSVESPNTNDTIESLESYINDYLTKTNLITPYYDSTIDCLAFNAEDGLYCPAINIKATKGTTRHGVRGIDVYCTNNIDDVHSYIQISDESVDAYGSMYYMRDAESALDVVNNFINSQTKLDYYDNGKDIEMTWGKNTFLGRGVVENSTSKYAKEQWLFYSDTSTWSIDIQYPKGDDYNKYLNIIESLE